MKMLISLLILAGAVQAQASATYKFVRQETTTTSGCRLEWEFERIDSNGVGPITWTGGCIGGKAEGYGVVSEAGTSSVYYTKYNNGKSLAYIEVKNGNPTPFALASAGMDGVYKDYDVCKTYKPCKALLDYYKDVKPKMPSNPSNNGKGGSNSSSKSSGSSSGGSRGSFGPITPPPHRSLRGVEGDRVACTDAVLKAKSEEIANQLMPRMQESSFCPSHLAGLEFIYKVITMIEKSCTKEQIPTVADMNEYRNALATALEVIGDTCP